MQCLKNMIHVKTNGKLLELQITQCKHLNGGVDVIVYKSKKGGKDQESI